MEQLVVANNWNGPRFNTFLCKIASRCNLNCSYCYMYQHADQSWRRRPVVMSEQVVNAFVKRLADYTNAVELESVTVLLHGGEPLLAGEDRLVDFVVKIRDALSNVPKLKFAMQTNGTLLNERWLAVIAQHEIDFGVSLDGDEAANDRARLDHGGRSSHQRVADTLRMISESPEIQRRRFQGILAVMDVRNDPLHTYNALKQYHPPKLDFLFPEGTHDVPPPFLRSGDHGTTPYADWLIPIFDEWFLSDDGPRIRLFENLLDVLLSGRSQTEGTGDGSLNLLTIETDGEIEDVDLLKTSYPGAGAILGGAHAPANVASHSFMELAESEEVKARHRLHTYAGLCATCQQCPAVRACGGGFLAHRWSLARNFDNPSIYCRDLYKLIRHISNAVGGSVVSLEKLGAISRGLAPLREEVCHSA